jgi:hypothetical protein
VSNKIYYNIDESVYNFETENFVYYFSSELYHSKFMSNYLKNRTELSYKLTSRYNIDLQNNDYFDFILYSNIEKRGFKTICKNTGGVFKCLKEVKFHGTITKTSN